MIEVLTLVIGLGIGIAVGYFLDKMHFYKTCKTGWKVSVWKSSTNNTEYVWARNDNNDITLSLDRNGVLIDYVSK